MERKGTSYEKIRRSNNSDKRIKNMGGSLKHFQPAEVVISKEQAGRTLRFFFPDQPIDAFSLSTEDVGFAQALLIEAVDSSKEMGYVQVVFDKTFMKIPTDFSFIKDILKALGKRALQNWFRHATKKDLDEPQIYESVRRTLAVNFRSIWAIRLQTGELAY